MELLLKKFPVVVEQQLVWGEMDAFQHLNNIYYFRFFENARIAYFAKLGIDKLIDDSGRGPILASVQCRFKIALTFPDKVFIGARVSQLEEERFVMEHAVVSEKSSAIAAIGEGMVVSYNYKEGKKCPLSDDLRKKISDLERSLGTPLQA